MRRAATPPPLHQLSAAVSTAVDTSAAMSSRPPHRGGRYGQHRGFSSERPYSGGRGQFVTGDSHLQSVRESNLGFRQGERGDYANNVGLYTVPPNHRTQVFGGNYQFRQAIPSSQTHQYQGPRSYTYNQQPPPFNPDQGVRTPQEFRPRRPKPLDYRHWDYAKQPPPSTCERFTILSYNILADYLAMDHSQKLYHHIDRYIMDWKWRKNNILFELGLWSTDIMCFQEVDRFHELEEALKVRGYSGIWKMRTGDRIDGCAIFWRVSRFKLVHEEYIEYNKLGLRDNVAQICVLEQRSQDDADNSVTPPISTSNHNKVVICNIHVLYNPNRGEIKLGQVRVLLEKAHAISKIWNNAPIVLCGDYNCTPKSALYNFISEQKLDLSGLHRDKVSGQYSARIHQPSSLYCNPRFQTANGSVPLEMRSESRDTERKPDSSLPETQKQDCPQSRMENEKFSSVNHSLPPDSSYRVVDASDNSWKDVQLGMEGLTLPSGGQKESQYGAHTSEKVSKLVSPLATVLKEPHLNASERRQMEKIDKDSKNSVDNIILDDAQLDSQTDLLESKNVPFTPPCQNSMADIAVDDGPSLCSPGIESAVDERPKNLSSDEQDVATLDGSLTEDGHTFLSALHDVEYPVSSEIHQSVSHQSLAAPQTSWKIENYTYDRSLWTPMEIQTATGNADCTLIEHPLKLRSTYTETQDVSGTRDLNGEPLVTSYNRCFLGTVDYIWRSEGLQTVRALAPIKKQVMQQTSAGFPTKKWGSDHIALATELAFVRSHEEGHNES